jgi:hypothetical protein
MKKLTDTEKTNLEYWYHLDPAFKAEWIAALRSGEYKQGFERLFQDDCYCAIGVAAKIAGIPDEILTGHGTIDLEHMNRIHKLELSSRIELLIPLDGGTNRNNLVHFIAKLANDNQKKSFPEIADWIEENVPVTSSKLKQNEHKLYIMAY